MHSKIINSSAGSYRATIGTGIFKQLLAGELAHLSSDRLFLIADENVLAQHRELLEESAGELCGQLFVYSVPPGEESKSTDQWEQCLDFLLQNGVRRNTPLLVAGGGITGDLGGFTAASALRGIPYIHIPTTLLAMVDSSIGGKTGINHSTGKNLIGAFYQPKAVIADTRFLQTLPQNEWVNGLSEILKYGAIRDHTIFEDAGIFLDGNASGMDYAKLSELISKCVQIKADIVQEDEFEGGIRAYLNFGHTFAHALEKVYDFNTISHGEAVYLGMLAACKLSELHGAEINSKKLEPFAKLYTFRISADTVSYSKIIDAMRQDKKRTDEHLKFVLLEDWQQPAVKTVKSLSRIEQALDHMFTHIP